jgi:hypothetical protein
VQPTHQPGGSREYHVAISVSPLFEGLTVRVAEGPQDLNRLKEGIRLSSAYSNAWVEPTAVLGTLCLLVGRDLEHGATPKHARAIGTQFSVSKGLQVVELVGNPTTNFIDIPRQLGSG